jgi:TonB-linked SusC/RagA family outer membrane protein
MFISFKSSHQRHFQFKSMKKNIHPKQRAFSLQWTKTLIAMKLAIVFTCIGIINASASAYSQTGKLTLHMKNTSIVEALNNIEKLTDYHFIYSLELVSNKKNISIKADKEPLKDVLQKLLIDNGVSYKLLDNNLIVVTPKTDIAPLKGMGHLSDPPVSVSGKVTDDHNVPLTGVTVRIKGTNIGTVTDMNGDFTINAPNENDTLVFTYVGYIDKSVPINGQTNLEVKLSASTTTLNNLVVIGYQSVSKRDLTGAVSVANTEDMNKITSGSVGEALQGMIPGVTVRNGGSPGQNSVVEIRGVGSFGNSSPLYVIDGMLADANTTINTDDIASVQVLKDASAAAIYGSKAANGVIIITTKKGKEGPAKFSFSAKYGVQQIPRVWDMMDANGYLQTVSKEYQNSNVNLPSGVADQLANPTISTDWQDEVYRMGNDQNYNVNVSGGSSTSSYLVSGSYYDNKGVLIDNNFRRTSLRINTQAEKGRFTIGENMMLSNTLGAQPGGGINPFYDAPQMLPIIAVQGDQYKSIPFNPGGWGMGTTDIPTYASNYIAEAALDKIKYNYAKLVGNGFVELKITNWLTYKFNLGAEVSFDYHKEVRDTGIWRYTNQPPATGVTEDRELFTHFLMDHTLNFNKHFGLHDINGVIGFSREQEKRTTTSAGRTNLQTVNGQLFNTINSALGNSTTGGGTPVFWRSHGYLGRINYSYNDKYLITLTGRIDQDSRFGPDYRTGYFPSAAAAWRISRENFFKVDWINDLKIRASYGKLGFSDVLGSWDYLGVLNNNPRAVYGESQSPRVGEYQANITNSNLRWETRIQKDIGFDASLLDNRLGVTVDLYNSTSKDVLVNLPLPQYLGSVGTSFANAGSIRNTGLEIGVSYRNDAHDFKWEIAANATTIKNKVLSVGNQGVDAEGNKVNYLQPTNFVRAQVGHSIGEWYVIKTAGIFQSQDEVDNYVDKTGKKIQPDAKPGDIKYVDANGDGVINDNDRQFAGSPWPTLQAGVQFNGTYKNFNINIQLVGIFGNTLYDDVRHAMDSYQLTNFRKDINPWSADNPKGTDPRLAVDIPTDPEVSINNMGQTTRWLENGSYVRLRNIEIGYSFPAEMFGSTGISYIHLYVSGQNLVTLTGYKGLDPDVVGTGIVTRGFDAGNWPSSRVLSVGLDFGF